MVYSAWFILILISILNCFRIIVKHGLTNVGEFRSYVIHMWFFTPKKWKTAYSITILSNLRYDLNTAPLIWFQKMFSYVTGVTQR